MVILWVSAMFAFAFYGHVSVGGLFALAVSVRLRYSSLSYFSCFIHSYLNLSFSNHYINLAPESSNTSHSHRYIEEVQDRKPAKGPGLCISYSRSRSEPSSNFELNAFSSSHQIQSYARFSPHSNSPTVIRKEVASSPFGAQRTFISAFNIPLRLC
jgi:hypothetical protein